MQAKKKERARDRKNGCVYYSSDELHGATRKADRRSGALRPTRSVAARRARSRQQPGARKEPLSVEEGPAVGQKICVQFDNGWYTGTVCGVDWPMYTVQVRALGAHN